MEAENGEYHIEVCLLTARLEIFLTPVHENAVNISLPTTQMTTLLSQPESTEELIKTTPANI